MLDSNKDNLKLEAMRRIIGVRETPLLRIALAAAPFVDDRQRQGCR